MATKYSSMNPPRPRPEIAEAHNCFREIIAAAKRGEASAADSVVVDALNSIDFFVAKTKKVLAPPPRPVQTGVVAAEPELLINSEWKHHTGEHYTLLLVTNGETDSPEKAKAFPTTAVYQGSDGRIWSRPWVDFTTHFTPIAGYRVKRDVSPTHPRGLTSGIVQFDDAPFQNPSEMYPGTSVDVR